MSQRHSPCLSVGQTSVTNSPPGLRGWHHTPPEVLRLVAIFLPITLSVAQEQIKVETSFPLQLSRENAPVSFSFSLTLTVLASPDRWAFHTPGLSVLPDTL